MFKRKRKRVPEVLWRLFHYQAKTLAEIIVSSIPSDCDCKGWSKIKCLHCYVFGAEAVQNYDAMSYLLRPHDPSDYKKLMNCCFVVVPDNAPPLPSHISSRRRWSQHQMVQKTIEIILTQDRRSPNLICCGFKWSGDLSPTAALLTSSAWQLVLRRIGDDMMNYLLMHTWIFLPHLQSQHQQVSGPPVNDLVFSRGTPLKRRRANNENKTVDRNDHETIIGPHLSKIRALISEIKSEEYNIEEESESKRITTKTSRKRLRLPSWKRRKRYKPVGHHDSATPDQQADCIHFGKLAKHHISEVRENEGASESDPRPKQEVNVVGQCICCSAFKTISGVPASSHIDRQPVFYNSRMSPSLFPEKHILNWLVPSFRGANDLLVDIFGLLDVGTRRRCCHCRTSCLYHNLLKLLKALIRRAKSCQHLRLLEKHCPVPFLSQDANGNAGSRIELCGRDTKVGKKVEVEVPLKRSQNTDVVDSKSNLTAIDNQLALNTSYCPEHQVVSFIWAACRSIIPPDLLGGPCNWRILRRNIFRFVRLRRFEKFSLKQSIHKLKTSRFQVLSCKYSLCDMEKHALHEGSIRIASGLHQYDEHVDIVGKINHYLLERWMFWFFSHIVVPVLQANFYVTESENGNHNLYMYRKSVWCKLSSEAMTSLKLQRYRSLNVSSVRNILSNRTFGFSKVRLRPKDNGVRTIANLKVSFGITNGSCPNGGYPAARSRKKKSCSGSQKTPFTTSVNHLLRDLHVILKDLKLRNSELWGSSIFDYNDVYRKLCPFVTSLKKVVPAMPAPFLVVSDVHKAFDTIDQDKLLNIMNEVLAKDEYLMESSWEVMSKKKRLWARENLKLVDQHLKTPTAGSRSKILSRSWHTVIIDQVKGRSVKKDQLTFILNELVKHNVLQMGRSFFLQKVGIPQGSRVSSLLCSLYYAHLEKISVFPFLQKGYLLEKRSSQGTIDIHEASGGPALSSPGCLLLRFIDDFLFICTSRKLATNLFLRLRRGFREYNCFMNDDKFGLNFNIDDPEFVSKRLMVDTDGISFLRWSGLLINCSTLEIQADYTRYLKNHLRSTLTVSWHDRPSRQLKAKLCDYLRPKCHPLFYDSNMNSGATVRLNVYQAFLLCAMKFHSYICELSTLYSLQPTICLAIIERSVSYMHKLIKRRIHAMLQSCDFCPIVELTKKEVQWLGLMAFIRVLQKKQTRHKKLVHLLTSKLVIYASIVNSFELKYAVDDSHSSVLWKIKY